jgi:DNA-binding NarL/FixJ family response regulator
MGDKLPDELTGERVRVGLVVTDPLRLLGLETIFEDDTTLQMVGLEVPSTADLNEFGLLILDAGCTEHFFELLAGFRRKYPRLKVIVIGSESAPEYVQRVIGAGAKGYLTHLAKESEIRMAIEIVLDGSVWAPRKVLAKLLEVNKSASAVETPKITAREDEVLRLLVTGRGNREIASSLGIDEVTVKAHVGRLMRKMGVANRIALTMQVMDQKLLARRAADRIVSTKR